MISVILVTYQSMKVLPDCLKSLEKCSSCDVLELWIVDNQSQDGTWEWIERYESEKSTKPFQNIHVMQLAENKGFAYANNRALEKAAGDYFLLLNPDTIVGENAIQVCYDKLKADQTIGAISCRLELGNGEMDRACRRSFPTLWNSFAYFSGLSKVFPNSPKFASYQLTYLDEYGSYPVDTVSGAFLMIPKAVYEIIGGLDEDYFMYGEDIDFCYQIKQSGLQVWYEGNATTIHLKGGNGGKISKSSLMNFYTTMGTFFGKHYSNKYPLWMIYLLKVSLYTIYFLKSVNK